MIHKYSAEEARQLLKLGEVPQKVGLIMDTALLTDAAELQELDTGFDWERIWQKNWLGTEKLKWKAMQQATIIVHLFNQAHYWILNDATYLQNTEPIMKHLMYNKQTDKHIQIINNTI